MTGFPDIVIAVHLADNVLAWPWWVGGWVVAGLLAFLGARQIRDDEIPRIALLTAAFFVSSSIHVRLGPSSAHLLLVGLLGVTLGRRAALAILVGVFMQAVLLPGHGGFSTIGINSCIMTLPALACIPLFMVLHRLRVAYRPGFRAALVGFSAMILVLSAISTVLLLYDSLASGSGVLDTALAQRVTFHPATLSIAGLLALLTIGIERKLDHSPDFPLGLLVGELSVLATVLLHCAVLILGGEQNWRIWALADVFVHLPIAVVEGVIVGFTVAFLMRVKPEMLIGGSVLPHDIRPEQKGPAAALGPSHQQAISNGPLLLPLAVVLLSPGAALAHNLEAEAVLRPGWLIQIESWFETGESAERATVVVCDSAGKVVVQGRTDARGIFVFPFTGVEPLRVVVDAGAGHRREVAISARQLQEYLAGMVIASVSPDPLPYLRAALLVPTAIDEDMPPVPVVRRRTGPQLTNLAIGVGILLGIAMLAVMWHRFRKGKLASGEPGP